MTQYAEVFQAASSLSPAAKDGAIAMQQYVTSLRTL
jgi:hypothetical protein